jgi:cold shock CspA family protein
VEHGLISWFNEKEGYGVISQDNVEIPVHKANFKKVPLATPQTGDKVIFRVTKKTSLGPEATEVVLYGKEAVTSKHKGLQRKRPHGRHTAYDLGSSRTHKPGSKIRFESKIGQIVVTVGGVRVQMPGGLPRSTTTSLDETQAEGLGQVMIKAKAQWPTSVAEVWLRSPNAFLEGARPIDIATTPAGVSEVMDALDAEASGQFA